MPRNPIAFTIAFFVPLTFVAGVHLGDVHTSLVPFLILVVIPSTDAAIAANAANPKEDKLKKL
jgi:hypothetical protein